MRNFGRLKKGFIKRGALASVFATTSILALSSASYAQEQDEPVSVLGTITVTAQKKEENLQNVGIAVTAFSGAQIEALGFQSTTDIVYQTPGLQLYEFSPSITVYNIRGVSQNSFSDNLEGPIAVYLDDAYISALGAQNQPIYDVERVEILKGPQGTLYGRNATGGLIHYISKKPTDEFEFDVSGSYGSYDFHEVEAAISGPITDNIRARLAVVDVAEDGYLKSTNPEVRDAYGKNSTAAKAFVEIDFGASSTLTLNPYWSEDSDVPTGAYVRREASQDPITGLAQASAFPNDPFAHSSDVEGRFDRDILGFTGKFEHDFGNDISFTSISNYQKMDKSYSEDSDARNVLVSDVFPGLAGAPFASLGAFNFRTNQEMEQMSQEIRFSGDTDKTSWQAGVYYLDIQQENTGLVEGFAGFWSDAAGGVSLKAQNDFNLSAKSLSVFAQGEYSFTDRVKLIGGLRWVDDDKEFDAYVRYVNFGTGAPVERGLDGEVAFFLGAGTDGGTIGPVCYSASVDARCAGDVADPAANFSYSDFAGKLQLDFAVNEDVLIYAGINRGTKGGNWATPSFPDSIRANGIDALAHTEETLWSYEAGLKSTMWEGRARLNAALFYYDYDDYQAFSLTNFVQNITNNDATVTGVEFDLTLNPVDGLDLLLGGSFVDSEVKGISTPNGVLIDTELPNAPSVSLNALARYAWQLEGGELSVQIDGNYNGEQYLEVTNPASSLEDAYLVSNARIGFRPNDNLDVAFWVKNLADTEYRIYSLDVAGAPAPFINDVFARPRTFGASVNISF